jgi:hypothetical protein
VPCGRVSTVFCSNRSARAELVEAVKLAFADSQKKRDAARTQALRPFFAVTESLLSETRREPLLDLIVSAMCGHLQCPQAACYQRDNQRFSHCFALGRRSLNDDLSDLISRADAFHPPLLVNASGPGDPALKALLSTSNLVL